MGSTIADARRIGSGASRRIWCVDLASGDAVIVREDTGDGPVAGTPLTLAREASVYAALADTDLPVPALRAVAPDGAALLLDRAPGDERLKDLDDDSRGAVAADYGRCLGRLHLLAPEALELGPLTNPPATDPTAQDLALWHGIHRTRGAAAASPAAAIALDALAAALPAPTGRAVLCHGDAGPGNFLHDGQRVTALLDWEFSHVGDPHDDLAWVAVRNQALRHPLDASIVFSAWRAATGQSLDLMRLEWLRALVLTRMLVSCDATIGWAGADAPAARVQAVLQPWLAVAVFEALRRAGLAATATTPSDEERDARRAWEQSPVAHVLDDPLHLDDLGALL